MIVVLADSPSPGNVSQTSRTVPRDGWLTGVDWTVIGIGGTGHVQSAVARNNTITVPSSVSVNGNEILSFCGGFAPAAANKFSQIDPEFFPAQSAIWMSSFAAATTSAAYAIAVCHFSESRPRGLDPPKEIAAGRQDFPRVRALSLPVVAARPGKAEEALRTKVVRADRAVACCRRGSLTVLRDVGLVLRDTFSVVEGLADDQVVVSVGGVLGTAPSLVRNSQGVLTEFESLLSRPVSAGGPVGGSSADFQRLIGRQITPIRAVPAGSLVSGNVAVLVGTVAAGFLIEAAAKTAALETMNLVTGAITSIREKRDCVNCITAALLSQAAPRRNIVEKIRKRV